MEGIIDLGQNTDIIKFILPVQKFKDSIFYNKSFRILILCLQE